MLTQHILRCATGKSVRYFSLSCAAGGGDTLPLIQKSVGFTKAKGEPAKIRCMPNFDPLNSGAGHEPLSSSVDRDRFLDAGVKFWTRGDQI